MNRMVRRLLFVVLPTLVALAGGIYFLVWRVAPGLILQPVQVFGSPLRAGDRVYLFTGQWRSRYSNAYNRYAPDETVWTTDLLVDLWAFDADTAAPLWRKRVQTELNGAMYGRSILGAQGNTLWLLVPKGLVAASLATGDLLADPASIEARNPPLRGLLPREASFFQFGAKGLRFRAADGRDWRIDPQSFAARPLAAGEPAATSVIAPAYYVPNTTSIFQERGLEIPGRWLGLLNDREMAELRDKRAVGDLDNQSRRRLWAARTTEATNFFGKYLTYSDFAPLGEEYLAPGLLTAKSGTGDGWSGSNLPLMLGNPDSVLVLHYDRLGEEGRLLLDRVAGPKGNTIWKAALPLSVLQSVMPGEHSLVLSGVLFTKPKDDRPRDPMNDAHDMLVSINIFNGDVHVHDQSDVDHHPAAVAAATP